MQAFNIMPKIREVDDLLQQHPAARSAIRECHPEVCFHAITGEPTTYRKSSAAGLNERLAALQRVVPEVHDLYDQALKNWRRKKVARDDILDAMVAAWTALGWPDELITLPDRPPRDSEGLPMEMVVRRRK